jgi:hypothetical protein
MSNSRSKSQFYVGMGIVSASVAQLIFIRLTSQILSTEIFAQFLSVFFIFGFVSLFASSPAMILELTRGKLKVGKRKIINIRGLSYSNTALFIIILLVVFYFNVGYRFSFYFYLTMILAMVTQTALSSQRGAFGHNQQWRLLFLQLFSEGLGKILLLLTLPKLHWNLLETLILANFLPALFVYIIFRTHQFPRSEPAGSVKNIVSSAASLPAIWLDNAATQSITFLPILVVANSDPSRIVEATRFALLASLVRIPLSFMPVLIAPMLASSWGNVRKIEKNDRNLGFYALAILFLPIIFFLQKYIFAFIYPDLKYASNWHYIGLDLTVLFLAASQFLTSKLIVRSMFTKTTIIWTIFFIIVFIDYYFFGSDLTLFTWLLAVAACGVTGLLFLTNSESLELVIRRVRNQ